MLDTIVAPITGRGPAAIAVVRLSGPESWRIASTVFHPWPSPVVPRLAVYGRFTHGDDGLMLPFESGASYTGEESVELSIHGSPASVALLVEACMRAGARMARPGEFTERAFLHGRIDLTQAEGIRAAIEAQTEAQLRQASLLREGALHRTVRQLRETTVDWLAQVEASVDFSEEIGDVDTAAAARSLGEAIAGIDHLLALGDSGELFSRGVRIAILGKPNAGKSSLFNALVGRDRAIVADVPGTTRDYVEAEVVLGGVPCVLVDTAGLRETQDRIESEGVSRARAVAASADAALYLFDAGQGLDDDDRAELGSAPRRVLLLASKSDSVSMPPADGTPVSAATGAGLDAIRTWVANLVRLDLALTEPFPLPRHLPLLAEARAALATAVDVFQGDAPADLAAAALRRAAESLGEITGESVQVDWAAEIFSRFCLGK